MHFYHLLPSYFGVTAEIAWILNNVCALPFLLPSVVQWGGAMPLTVQNHFKRFHITFPPRVPGLREVKFSRRAYALCNIAHSPEEEEEEEEESRSTAAAVPVMTIVRAVDPPEPRYVTRPEHQLTKQSFGATPGSTSCDSPLCAPSDTKAPVPHLRLQLPWVVHWSV